MFKTIIEIKRIAKQMGVDECLMRGNKELMIMRICSHWQGLINFCVISGEKQDKLPMWRKELEEFNKLILKKP